MTLKISPMALQDLKDIREYISVKLCNPTAAERTVRKIISSYSQLTDSPFIGSSLNTKINIATPYRYLVSGNYLVFYKINDDFIEIIRIIYGRRDYIKILFKSSFENLDSFDEDTPE